MKLLVCSEDLSRWQLFEIGICNDTSTLYCPVANESHKNKYSELKQQQ